MILKYIADGDAENVEPGIPLEIDIVKNKFMTAI